MSVATSPRTTPLEEIYAEIDRQYAKWGEQNHDATYWMGILMEEMGEAAKGAIEFDMPAYRAELIHVAAVAINAIASFDRQS